MTIHALRNAALALLIAAPAFAQSAPELPTMSEFRKSIDHAEAPPPAETKDKPAVVVTPSGTSAFYKATEAVAWSGTALDAYSTAKVIGAGGHEVGMYRVVGDRNTAAILAFAGGYEALMTLYSRHLYKTGHPKLAAGMNLMRGGIHFAAGAHNMSILPPAKP